MNIVITLHGAICGAVWEPINGDQLQKAVSCDCDKVLIIRLTEVNSEYSSLDAVAGGTKPLDSNTWWQSTIRIQALAAPVMAAAETTAKNYTVATAVSPTAGASSNTVNSHSSTASHTSRQRSRYNLSYTNTAAETLYI